MDQNNQSRKEWQREYRKTLKHLHLCRECHRRDAFTLNGMAMCAECTEKGRLRKQEYLQKPENRDRTNAAQRKKRAERAENGCCTNCGTLLHDGNYKLCPKCRAKCRKYKNRATRKRGISPRTEGICWQCNKAPVMAERGLCEACYVKKVPIALKNLEKAHENNPWKGFRYGKYANKNKEAH